jgi:NMT1/THI5 like
VQLKWEHQFQFAGYYAALEQGFYRAAGLDVIIREGRPNIDGAFQSGRQEPGRSGRPARLLDQGGREWADARFRPSSLPIGGAPGSVLATAPEVAAGRALLPSKNVATAGSGFASVSSSQSPDTSIPMDWSLELACY